MHVQSSHKTCLVKDRKKWLHQWGGLQGVGFSILQPPYLPLPPICLPPPFSERRARSARKIFLFPLPPPFSPLSLLPLFSLLPPPFLPPPIPLFFFLPLPHPLPAPSSPTSLLYRKAASCNKTPYLSLK